MPQFVCPESAIRTDDAMLEASFELSQSSWVLTLRLPGSARLSRYSLAAGAAAEALALLRRQAERGAERLGKRVGIVCIQEAGLDGFWLHRVLSAHDIESHVVDAASIAAPRRQRRAKSDGIDGETLLRTLAAWRRGEPRVCSMVRVPSVAEEDRRQIVRERAQLLRERIALSNGIKGRLASQGVRGYEPLRRDRRTQLARLRTGDGRELPAHLRAVIERMLTRLELLLAQLKDVEAARAALLAAAPANSPAVLLGRLCGIGAEGASLLSLECFYRSFGDRRQLAAFAGLAPSPWRSGSIQHEQGISKAGRPRLRKLMIELAWMWLRYQPGSALSRWFQAKVAGAHGRLRRIAVVALARKLLVALWRYVSAGELPSGARLRAA